MALVFAANLSMLYPEVPFLDRFERAAAAGFAAVEFLFPYEAGVPAVRARLDELGLSVALFNLHAGDPSAGEWGTLSNPARRDFFRHSLAEALEAARALGCPRLNAMYGQRVPGLDPASQAACALENLVWAAPQAADAGVTLLLEPLNPVDFPNYALLGTAHTLEIISAANHPAVQLQYDVYHAAMAGERVVESIEALFPAIGHIQVADVPSRHEPGTGTIDFPAVFATVERLGYRGAIGLEYRPSGDTEASLSWLPRNARRQGERAG